MKLSYLLPSALLLLTGQAFSAVIYTTDTTSSLVGSLTYDIVLDGGGVGTTIASFPHFHVDLGVDGYTAGDTQLFIGTEGLNFVVEKGRT